MHARALAAAVAAAAAVWVVWRGFVASTTGQQVEQVAWDGAVRWPVAEVVLDAVSVGFVAGALVLAVVVAAVRREWLLAARAAVLVAAANLTTAVLKNAVLDRPELTGPPHSNSLPSGHTTAAASAFVALLFVVPARIRPAVAAIGATWTVLTGGSTLAQHWHRPSDVVAGVLVVVTWAGLVCAWPGAPSAGPAGPEAARAVRRATGVLAGVGLAAGVAAVVALARTWAARADPTRLDELFAHVGGLAATLSASALGFVVVLALRHELDGGS